MNYYKAQNQIPPMIFKCFDSSHYNNDAHFELFNNKLLKTNKTNKPIHIFTIRYFISKIWYT